MAPVILLSQRVAEIASYGERRDCLDQKWSSLIEACGFCPVPVPNTLSDPVAWAGTFHVRGILLTGGNDIATLPGAGNVAPERDRTEHELLRWAESTHLPVLGVCRGLQMINMYCGGSLKPAEGHTAVRHLLQWVPSEAGPPGTPFADTVLRFASSEVNSFHDFAVTIDSIPSSLRPLLRCGEVIEAFVHRSLPWAGFMWHPERENPFDERDIELIRGQFQ